MIQLESKQINYCVQHWHVKWNVSMLACIMQTMFGQTNNDFKNLLRWIYSLVVCQGVSIQSLCTQCSHCSFTKGYYS